MNISPLLFSRDLNPEDYLSLKYSYFKLIEDASYLKPASYYLDIFLQHFVKESLEDIQMRPVFINAIQTNSLDSMFERDLKNLYQKTFDYINQIGLTGEEAKNIIIRLFQSHFHSKHSSNKNLKGEIKELIIKKGMNVQDVILIAKSQDSDTRYLNWCDQF